MHPNACHNCNSNNLSHQAAASFSPLTILEAVWYLNRARSESQRHNTCLSTFSHFTAHVYDSCQSHAARAIR